MKLTIGETIKRLRREKDLTQEEIATHLGISPQSVSKWERGEGYPDITMLPSMATYFNVSIDTLMGMERNTETYRNINEKWELNRQNGQHFDNVELMRNALRIFPNDDLLLVQLSSSLERLSGTEKEKSQYLRESIAVQEQILKYCNDSPVRGATLYNICFSYAKNGEYERAVECANKLPNLYKNRENALEHLLQGDAKTKNSRSALEPLAWAVKKHLYVIAEAEDKQEYKTMADDIAEKLRFIFLIHQN